MTTLAFVEGSVSVLEYRPFDPDFGPSVQVRATVLRDPDAAEVAHSVSTVSGSPALPGRFVGVQVANPEIYVDGVRIPASRLVGDWHYGRDISRGVQSFSFSIWTQEFDRYFDADPVETFAPGPCANEVDVHGVYLSPSGTKLSYPLITGGIVDHQERAYIGGSAVESLVVMDRGARAQRSSVTATYPAGGSWTRDQVARAIMALAGYPSTRFEAMGRTSRELILVDADPINALQELFSVESRSFVFTPDGIPSNPRYRPTAAPKLHLTARDVFEVTPLVFSGDAITRLTATGERHDVTDTDLTYEDLEFETYSDFNGDPVRYSQTPVTGALTEVGSWPGRTPSRQLVERTTITRTFRCGTLIAQRTRRFGFKNIARARYDWNGSAFVARGGAVYVRDGATANDEAEGFASIVDRWMLLEDSEERFFYDADGFPRSDEFTVFSSSWPTISRDAGLSPRRLFNFGTPNANTGSYLGRSLRRKGWHSFEEALKSRTGHTDTFESLGFRSGLSIRGPLVGMADPSEVFGPVAGEYERVESDADGVIQRRVLLTMGVPRFPGNKHLYSDGSVGREAQDSYGPVKLSVETITGNSAAKHTVRVETVDYSSTSGPVITISSVSGAAPQVDRVRIAGAGEVLLTNPGAVASGCIPTVAAVPIKVNLTSPALEGCRLPRIERIQFAGAESVSELQAAGETAIRESVEPAVAVTMPLHFGMVEGVSILLTFPQLGLSAREVMIRSVDHRGSWGGPRVPRTVVSGKIRSGEE